MSGKYLIVVVMLACILSVGAIHVWQNGQTGQTEENTQMGENIPLENIFSISELWSNRENLENETVEVNGTIIAIYSVNENSYSITISDNTGEITCKGSGSFPYDVGENVVIDGEVKVTSLETSSSWQELGAVLVWIKIQKIENAQTGENAPTGENMQSEIENVELSYLEQHMEEFENKRVRVTGTVAYDSDYHAVLVIQVCSITQI
jgi:hypothetical protein